ncbi:hypothetical protein SAMN05446935_8422 [Burkholderia sp. YR290]|nr:hypothetical protein SAMN05446935_8422 [Burkholderia sp. YR290]
MFRIANQLLTNTAELYIQTTGAALMTMTYATT